MKTGTTSITAILHEPNLKGDQISNHNIVFQKLFNLGTFYGMDQERASFRSFVAADKRPVE